MALTNPLFPIGAASINPSEKALIDEFNYYKAANPDKATTLEDYRMMKNLKGDVNINLNSASTTIPIPDIKNNIINSTTDTTLADAAASTPDELAKIYQADMDSIAAQKKYLIANAIGQGILNMSNLSQANAKAPNAVGIGAIPNVEYPNVSNPMLAELQAAEGRYRSGVARLAAEKGLSPEARIGAEANVLSSDLTQRANINKLQNESDIAEITANSAINAKNLENQYAARIANTTRQDAIAANRSALFSQGLSNIGVVGTAVGKNLAALEQQKNNLATTNYYLKKMDETKGTAEYSTWVEAYLLHQNPAQAVNIATNNPAKNTEQVKYNG